MLEIFLSIKNCNFSIHHHLYWKRLPCQTCKYSPCNRFEGAAGTQMPESAPGAYQCGTYGAGWLSGNLIVIKYLFKNLIQKTFEQKTIFIWKIRRASYCGGGGGDKNYQLPKLQQRCILDQNCPSGQLWTILCVSPNYPALMRSGILRIRCTR